MICDDGEGFVETGEFAVIVASAGDVESEFAGSSIDENCLLPVREFINAENELDVVEELRRGVDHPLTVAFIVQMAAAAEEKHEVIHTHGLLVGVEALEQTEDLQGSDSRNGAVFHTKREGRRDGEGIISGGNQNGGVGSNRNTLLETFQNTLEGTNLREIDRLLVVRELESHGIQIGGLL